MSLFDYFNYSFEDFYQSPLVVLIAFFLLIFAIVFSSLKKTRLGENTPSITVISLIISAIAVYSIKNYTHWLASFNLLLILAVFLLFFVVINPFFRFLKRIFFR